MFVATKTLPVASAATALAPLKSALVPVPSA
jgi:hypothetical protein